jgi:hypothetical protein
LRCDPGFTLFQLAPFLFSDGADGVARNLLRTGDCSLTITSSESVDDAFPDCQRTELRVYAVSVWAAM